MIIGYNCLLITYFHETRKTYLNLFNYDLQNVIVSICKTITREQISIEIKFLLNGNTHFFQLINPSTLFGNSLIIMAITLPKAS